MDVYREIHKAIRLLLADLGTKAATTDFGSPAGLHAFREDVSAAFRLLASHTREEETFFRPLLDEPGADLGSRLSTSHADQGAQMEKLMRRLAAIDPSASDAAARGHAFLLALSRFTAELLDHMADEEELANPVLWRATDDAGLLALEARITAERPPEETALLQRLRFPGPA